MKLLSLGEKNLPLLKGMTRIRNSLLREGAIYYTGEYHSSYLKQDLKDVHVSVLLLLLNSY